MILRKSQSFLSIIICYILLGFNISTTSGQEHHVCGTSIEDQLLADEMMARSSASDIVLDRNDIIYVPVKFHVVTRGDGSGGVKEGAILAQLCKLNKDFAPWDIRFYPKDGFTYNYINRSDAYQDPRSNENVLRGRKDNSALNIFLVGDIGASQGGPGTVLGYYSPSNDLIVCLNSRVSGTDNTLSHEVGHFFSLRHTFFGWECDPYDISKHGNPLKIAQAPCFSIPNEKVDKSNCKDASDGHCDTPPDYNFGIGSYSNGCGISIIARDINGDTIITMANNQMGYFTSCPDYFFTEEQSDKMISNYNLSIRDFLKSNYKPNETEITTEMVFSQPTEPVSEYYNSIYFEWNEAPNASIYMLEVTNGIDNNYYYTTNTNYLVTDLMKKSTYFYKVYPLNDGYTCASPSTAGLIQTNDQTTSSKDLEVFNNVSLYPNPTANRSILAFDYPSSGMGKLSILNSNGVVISNTDEAISAGRNNLEIDVSTMYNGVYLVRLQTSNGYLTRKLLIAK